MGRASALVLSPLTIEWMLHPLRTRGNRPLPALRSRVPGPRTGGEMSAERRRTTPTQGTRRRCPPASPRRPPLGPFVDAPQRGRRDLSSCLRSRTPGPRGRNTSRRSSKSSRMLDAAPDLSPPPRDTEATDDPKGPDGCGECFHPVLHHRQHVCCDCGSHSLRHGHGPFLDADLRKAPPVQHLALYRQGADPKWRCDWCWAKRPVGNELAQRMGKVTGTYLHLDRTPKVHADERFAVRKKVRYFCCDGCRRNGGLTELFVWGIGFTTKTIENAPGRAISTGEPCTAEGSANVAPSPSAMAAGCPPPLPRSIFHALQPTNRRT